MQLKSAAASFLGVLLVSSLSAAALKSSTKKDKFGFYFPVHGQVPSTLNVLKAVRKFYPASPIYLLQDGSNVDFGPLCKTPEYNCMFERVTGENSRWNPHSWFARFRKATQILDTEFVIYLEPDVLIKRRHSIEPTADAGGVFDDFNPKMHRETMTYLEKMGRERDPSFNVTWEHFGLCGGSYYRSKAVLDAFAPEHVKRIDFKNMGKLEGDKTMSSDFAMLVALYARGWKVYPWEETSQHWGDPRKPGEKERKSERSEAAFEHAHKEHYHDEVSPQDKQLIAMFKERLPDTSCHGCIWYHDADPNQRLEKEQEQPDVQHQWRYSLQFKKFALLTAAEEIQLQSFLSDDE